MSKKFSESVAVLEATTVAGQPGKLLIGLITPGQGSSGYYSPPVLEAAAKDKIFAAGTHMYFDHPTESDKHERPERSLRDLAAVLSEDARWDGSKLVAEANVFGPYRDVLADKEFAKAIGVSIRGSAEMQEGEVDGQRTRIISRLVEADSVDFVTHAGRGGSILDIYESARPAAVNEKAIAHGVEESTVNDRREALSTALKDAYGAEKVWVWLRDFDDTTVWFNIDTPDEEGTWQQDYTSGPDGLVTALTDGRFEVRAITQYVPAIPAGPTTTQESHKEDIMAETKIEETRLRDLEEAAGRVPVLEAERDTAIKERDEALAESAKSRDEVREARIGTIIAEADAEFDDLQVAGLKAQAPVKEGVLDEAAFKTTVDEAAAKVAEADGAGKPRGHGRTVTPDSEAELREANDKQRAAMFGRTIKEA